MPSTLFDKIWRRHVILEQPDGPSLLYVDRNIVHDGTFHAFETLRHVLDVEWSWRMFCIGSDTGDALIWDVEPLDDLPSVKARWRQEGEDMLRYVQSLSEDELTRQITSPSGQHIVTIRDILMHVLNHATNHRSELG